MLVGFSKFCWKVLGLGNFDEYLGRRNDDFEGVHGGYGFSK